MKRIAILCILSVAATASTQAPGCDHSLILQQLARFESWSEVLQCQFRDNAVLEAYFRGRKEAFGEAAHLVESAP